MGQGASSSNKFSATSQNIVDAMTQSIMNCKGNGMITQTFTINGNYNNVTVKQVQAYSIDSTCANSAQSLASIQSAVSNAIQQAASSQNVALLGALGSSSSEVNTTIDNQVKATITSQAISNIINNTTMAQQAIVNGNNNIAVIDQAQTATVVANNCLSLLSQMSSFQTVTNDVSQTTSATLSNPISDILDSVFGGLQGLSMIFVFAFVAIVIVGAYVFINGINPISIIFNSDDGEEQQFTQQPYPSQPIQQ